MDEILTAITDLTVANADRDILVLSREINRQVHYDLSELLRARQQRKGKCTLFLTTLGGDPAGGYRMARCLRHYYQHVRLVIPSFCKSAGTLITICADELVIGDLGELGPLDIQVPNAQELAERSSGLDIIQALQASLEHVQEAFRKSLIELRNGARLSTRLAGEFASKLAIGVAAPLYSQIDPNRIGEMQRAMRIAHEYGFRLNQYTNALKPGALDTLVASYPAHGFVLDRKEAKELFNTVHHPSDVEDAFCRALWHIFKEQGNFGPQYIDLPAADPGDQNGPEFADQAAQAHAAVRNIEEPARGPAEANGEGQPVREDGVPKADRE